MDVILSNDNTDNTLNDNTKGNNISDIMKLVKSGKLSKSEALNELQKRLQQSSLKRNIDLTKLSNNDEKIIEKDEIPLESNNNNNIIINNNNELDDNLDKISNISGSSRISRFSREDRRNIINKLVEKRRNDTKQNQIDNNSDNDENKPEVNTSDNDLNKSKKYFDSNEDSDNSPFASDPISNSTGNFDNWSPDGKIDKNYQYDYSSPQIYDNYGQRRSFDDSSIRGPLVRSSRILQSEAAIREEMFKECTFRPVIKPLPNHYVSTKDMEAPFLQRVNKWNKDKTQTIEKKRKDFQKIQKQDCSFHPTINRHSFRAMVEVRGKSQEPATDRLYRSAITSASQKLKFVDDYRKIADVIYKQDYTFKPQLSTKGRFEYINPKYNNPVDKSHNKDISKPIEMKECTFTPKVRGIKPHMNSAKLYLSTNVVDRLSRPMSASLDEASRSVDDSRVNDISYNERTIMNVQSFMNTMQGRDRKRSHSAPRERRNSDSNTNYIDEKQFQNFLLRQKHLAEFNAKKLEEKKMLLTPQFQPELCTRSLILSEATTRGEFLERVERDVSRRKDKENKIKSNIIPSYTFQPKINEKSLKLRSRSVQDMSRGDLLKKETNNRINREKIESEQFLDMTFNPEISSKAKLMGKSIIKSITEDSSTFKQWYQEKQNKLEEKRRAELENKINEELKDCTFTPKTKDCPAYVKRIAKSMAIVKAARSNEINTNNTKPDWK